MSSVDHLLASRVALRADAIAAAWAGAWFVGGAAANLRRADFAARLVRSLVVEGAATPEFIAEEVGWMIALERDRGGALDSVLREVIGLEGLLLEAIAEEVAGAPLAYGAAEVIDVVSAVRSLVGRVVAAAGASAHAATVAQQRFHRDGLVRFAHDLGHELKNRLGIATLASTMLGEALESGDEERARALGRRLGEILGQLRGGVGDVLAVALGRLGGRAEPAARRPLDEVLASLGSEFAIFAASLGVTLEMPAAPPAIEVDAGRFRVVLANLLHNAIKFADPAKSRRFVRVQVVPAGVAGMWRLDVTDNGRGVPSGVRDAIFDAGVRVDPSTPGQGLGLALARQAALQLGGYLWVTSAVGRGSTFSFTFTEVAA